MFYIPWFGFLNKSPILLFAGLKKCQLLKCQKIQNFLPLLQFSEFWAINRHKCVPICKFTEQFFFWIWCQSYGHLSNLPKNKLSIYSTKGRQFWCNIMWKFVEDTFTYLKAPCKNFCDYRLDPVNSNSLLTTFFFKLSGFLN